MPRPPAKLKLSGDVYHTYLRPHSSRHPILHGFEETDILPYGGLLEPLHMDPGAESPYDLIRNSRYFRRR